MSLAEQLWLWCCPPTLTVTFSTNPVLCIVVFAALEQSIPTAVLSTRSVMSKSDCFILHSQVGAVLWRQAITLCVGHIRMLSGSQILSTSVALFRIATSTCVCHRGVEKLTSIIAHRELKLLILVRGQRMQVESRSLQLSL